MAIWTRKFAKPIRTSAGQTITTIEDARRFMLKLDDCRTWRNEWQNAAGKLLAASRGGSVAEAREALRMALFLNMMLDLDSD